MSWATPCMAESPKRERWGQSSSFIGQMPFLLPNQQHQSSQGNRCIAVTRTCLWYNTWSQTRLFFLGAFNRDASGSPLLQLRRRDEAGGVGGRRAPASRLPPVVIVLADHLQNVADRELNAGLLARYELVADRVELKQRSHEYLKNHTTACHAQKKQTSSTTLTAIFQWLPGLSGSPKKT